MGRYLGLIYGTACYAIFFVTFLYLVGFLGNVVVPKTIDSGSAGPAAVAVAVNLGLIVLFGVQHSIMARPAFKARWTKIVPRSVERSTYVLVASLALIALYALWQPLPAVVWRAEAPWLVALLWGIFAAGLLLVLLSTFVINHFDLFGLRQVFLNWRRKPYVDLPFQVSSFYRFVRHPLYVGWFLAFWGTPHMTVGHLLFAAGMSVYIIVAVRHEERDLARALGADYVEYCRRVPKFVPRLGHAHEPVRAGTRQPLASR